MDGTDRIPGRVLGGIGRALTTARAGNAPRSALQHPGLGGRNVVARTGRQVARRGRRMGVRPV